MVDEDGKNLVNSVWLPKADRNHKWVNFLVLILILRAEGLLIL